MGTQPLMTLESALASMRAAASPLASGHESIPLEAARGRILAENINAPISLPPFAASAMDGYAVASEDAVFCSDGPYVLPVQAHREAGHAPQLELQPDHAVRIFTGAPMPLRADAVIIQENTTVTGDCVSTPVRPERGQNVRPVGNDVTARQLLFTAGHRLEVFDLGQLAACGFATVTVRQPLRITVFSTGNELQEPGAVLTFGQIYESNRFLLTRLLDGLPVVVRDLGILADDLEVIEAALGEAAGNADVVLTSGGVSVGDADYVRGAVQRLGSITHWRLAIKPGKPIAHGRIKESYFFGLPGNPVSAVVTLLLVVKPMLLYLAGADIDEAPSITATLQHPLRHEPGRAEFQRGRLVERDGCLEVAVDEEQGSNRLASFRNANCLICIAAHSGNLDAGERVRVLPFRGLLD